MLSVVVGVVDEGVVWSEVGMVSEEAETERTGEEEEGEEGGGGVGRGEERDDGRAFSMG